MTVFYSEPTVNAGYLNVKDGSTYCHSVYRIFRAQKLLATDKEITLKKFLKICPLDETTVRAAFEEGKSFVNEYQDIYNGKKDVKQIWEWGYLYRSTWENRETREIAALDGTWYAEQTYAEHKTWFNKIFGARTKS